LLKSAVTTAWGFVPTGKLPAGLKLISWRVSSVSKHALLMRRDRERWRLLSDTVISF
jgi:hypothetical protein